MTSLSLGVLGGTFDPIHVGHLAAADDVANVLHLDRVLFVPNHIPPHKRDRNVTPAADRAEMVRLAIAGNDRFELSTVELERDGPSYTLDTMRELRRQYGETAELSFLTGCDSLAALHIWHKPHLLLKEFRVVIVERPTDSAIDWQALERDFPGIRGQVKVVDIPRLQISSQDIRARVSEGRPFRYYVTDRVAQYIRDKGLYR